MDALKEYWPLICCSAPVILIGLLAAVLTIGSWINRSRMKAGGDFRNARRVKRGQGLSVDELARRLDVSRESLEAFGPRYDRAFIPKKRGGARALMIPHHETRAMQRRVLHRLLAKLRAHDAAHGFERERSIVTHAQQHTSKVVVIRMDIVDFFPSTTAQRIDHYFRWIGWDADAAAILTRICTFEDGLPQGAPTSPRLSNLVNHYLDVQMTTVMRRRYATYSRYADDITISLTKDHPRRVRGIIQFTKRLLKAHGYTMHEREKLHIRRSHQQQRVTGLIVNDDRPRLPRKTRRWLRAVKHRQSQGKPITLTPEQLQGWLAYEHMVEGGRR